MLLAGSTRYLGTQKAQALIIGFRPPSSSRGKKKKGPITRHLNPPHPIAYSRETIGKSMKNVALLLSLHFAVNSAIDPSPILVPRADA